MSLTRSMARLVTVLIAGILSATASSYGQTQCNDGPVAVCAETTEGALPLIIDGKPIPIIAAAEDDAGVLRAVNNLHQDLGAVGGEVGALSLDGDVQSDTAIIVGTLDSPLISGLINEGKLDASSLDGEWEAYVQTVVDTPMDGIDRALVIAGSDRRGTIYGIYDLVERAGVSPWAWWADVPVRQSEALFVSSGTRTDKPVVKYRGIFLNDENPALYGWVNETYGGFNAQFYERVFDLILRLKGNYLWPAMWGKALYDDDPTTGALADEMGVVIGTSHHEPLMRAHVEWERYGEGPWDYTQNAEKLREFWRGGMERAKDFDTIVTVGMRGDGDEAMTEGTAIDLLETIVTGQRKIIEDVTGAPASERPQLWALYKEVQDYYDKGMEVPDDITLLFADDNWGNIRRLPDLDAKRQGGYGIYFHFDYVGGPRNYKWLNTTQIERVWEQMHMAWQYDANEIWIVNVGDLKPMEFPIDFFLDFAWDPTDWPLERLPAYSTEWAAQHFGEDHAEDIADLIDTYTKYNARRKPELLSPETYSLVNYREFERVVLDYNALADWADKVRSKLPAKYDDAYMQLVWWPIHASANLNELYYTAALNRLYAEQGRNMTNDMADQVQALFDRDAELTDIYHGINDGKWNHFASQTHIGYTYWQQPDQNNIPETERIEVPRKGSVGVAIEGSRQSWPSADGQATLPQVDRFNKQVRHIEAFNKGKRPVRYEITADQPWVSVSQPKARVKSQNTHQVSVDFDAAPAGRAEVILTVSGGGEDIEVILPVFNPQAEQIMGYPVTASPAFIEADRCTAKVERNGIQFAVVPDLGLTGSTVITMPVTAPVQPVDGSGPYLEYAVHTFEGSSLTVETRFAPSLDYDGQDGLRYAIAIDDEEPQIVNIALDPEKQGYEWGQSVAHYAHINRTTHAVDEPGAHTVKIWPIDPGFVLQRLTVATGNIPESYLGGPETRALGDTQCGLTR